MSRDGQSYPTAIERHSLGKAGESGEPTSEPLSGWTCFFTGLQQGDPDYGDATPLDWEHHSKRLDRSFLHMGVQELVRDWLGEMVTKVYPLTQLPNHLELKLDVARFGDFPRKVRVRLVVEEIPSDDE